MRLKHKEESAETTGSPIRSFAKPVSTCCCDDTRVENINLQITKTVTGDRLPNLHLEMWGKEKASVSWRHLSSPRTRYHPSEEQLRAWNNVWGQLGPSEGWLALCQCCYSRLVALTMESCVTITHHFIQNWDLRIAVHLKAAARTGVCFGEGVSRCTFETAPLSTVGSLFR